MRHRNGVNNAYRFSRIYADAEMAEISTRIHAQIARRPIHVGTEKVQGFGEKYVAELRMRHAQRSVRLNRNAERGVLNSHSVLFNVVFSRHIYKKRRGIVGAEFNAHIVILTSARIGRTE